MSKKGKSFVLLLLTITLLMIMNGKTAYAYIGNIFNYTNEGQTLTYKVLSEPTETENGTAEVIFSLEANKNLVGEVTIPATVTNQRMTYNIIAIDKNSFLEAKGIERITLPDTIKTIGADAFVNCSSLTSINIPSGVSRIEDSTFHGCDNLNSIMLPDGLFYIGGRAFYNCKSLSDINLPDRLTYIGENAFYDCNKLTSLYLPKGVNYLGAGAFEGCSHLISINIPEGITSIEPMLFQDCTSLTSISMPEGIDSIGKYAFYNCTSLKSIHLTDDITRIGEYAFYLCTSLTSIKIPYGVTKIEDYTFLGCSSLTQIGIQDKVISIGNFALYGCSNLITINLPDNLTSIGNMAFFGCENLRPIRIPSGVTSIGFGEFPYCGVYVYKNSFAETFFKKNHPEYYQIIKLPLEEMSFAENKLNIKVDDTVPLKLNFYPTFSSDITDSISWNSSDQSIVSVNTKGEVKGIKAGEADITAVMGEYSAICHIIVDGITVNPTSINFTNNKIGLNKGESTKLSLNFTPADSTNRLITWSSSDDTIVTVVDGRVYANNIGTAIITATSEVATTECKVTVYNPLKEIFSDYNRITLDKGETKRIAISYAPVDTSDDKTTIWRSEDEAVVTIDNGVLKAVQPGTTTIKATVGVLTLTIPVIVQIPVKSLSLSQKEIALTVGQTQTLPLVVLPEDTSDDIIVTSSDESVATYSGGSITAWKRGTTTITAVCGAFTRSCIVTVGTDIESITLNKESIKLYLGSSATLTVNFQPMNVMDSKTITWTSSDKTVVTVSSKGAIKTIGTGTATITAVVGGGITASCSVVVKLSVPTAVKAVSGGFDNVMISWGKIKGASGYQIYRADSITRKYVKIVDTKSNSFINTPLITGTTYYYKVRGYRYQGSKKVYSSFTKVISAIPVLSTPGNVKLVKVKAGKIYFTWDMVNGASGYEVYRASSKTLTLSLVTRTTSLHFINSGLTKGRTYFYKVRAYKMIGKQKVYSEFSTVYSVVI